MKTTSNPFIYGSAVLVGVAGMLLLVVNNLKSGDILKPMSLIGIGVASIYTIWTLVRFVRSIR